MVTITLGSVTKPKQIVTVSLGSVTISKQIVTVCLGFVTIGKVIVTDALGFVTIAKTIVTVLLGFVTKGKQIVTVALGFVTISSLLLLLTHEPIRMLLGRKKERRNFGMIRGCSCESLMTCVNNYNRFKIKRLKKYT